MSNAEKPTEDAKNSNPANAEENVNALTQSDTCLLNNTVDSNLASGSKKNKHQKNQASASFSAMPQKTDKSGIKQKIVNKVMSWNAGKSSPTKNYETDMLSAGIEGISLSQDTSEENLCKPDWLRARDSLENLLYNRNEKQPSCGEIINSRSAPFSSQEKSLSESSPHSEATLGNKTPCSQSIAKVLNWDPWDKLGRKNKRDTKRRKLEKSSLPSRDSSSHRCGEVDSSRKDHTSGDELRPNEIQTIEARTAEATQDDEEQEEYPETYEYQPYNARNSKSVDFTNEVMVVYFTGDEVVGETKEPLKKELDQQIRNKEMRKGHCPAMLTPKRKQLCDDYMALWFKK